jgi:hypothetical protein
MGKFQSLVHGVWVCHRCAFPSFQLIDACMQIPSRKPIGCVDAGGGLKECSARLFPESNGGAQLFQIVLGESRHERVCIHELWLRGNKV